MSFSNEKNDALLDQANSVDFYVTCCTRYVEAGGEIIGTFTACSGLSGELAVYDACKKATQKARDFIKKIEE